MSGPDCTKEEGKSSELGKENEDEKVKMIECVGVRREVRLWQRCRVERP